MKRILRFASVIILSFLIWILVRYYPQLDLISGFAAKNVCSCTFEAARDLKSIESGDNDFMPVSYASNKINLEEQAVTSSFLGLKQRKAVFRKGLGCVLLPEGGTAYDLAMPIPNRNYSSNKSSYPYGDGHPQDSIFPNIDYNMLQTSVHNAFDTDGELLKRTRAVIVLYKDHLIMEAYAPDFSKETKLLGWSMTKSITSTLLGVLEKQKRISVSQDNLFPEWEGSNRSKITLDNLLRMNSGLKWEEDYTKISDVTKMLFLEEDMSRLQLEKELMLEGNPWNYSSGTSNLLSRFIRQQFDSQQEYLDFWYRELIDKIGMHSMTLETDLAGNYVGSSYSWATPRDWAKLGLLYLNGGKWNGEQLLNESWIDYTTTPTPGSHGEYGAHVWLNAGAKFPNVPLDMYSANGFQGQHVFVIPSKELVVVRFGLVEHPQFEMDTFLSGIVGAIEGNLSEKGEELLSQAGLPLQVNNP